MRDETITQAVSERYAKAVTTGETMCCPTGYNHEDLKTFIPEAVLNVSYGCGTPVGLTTVQPGETVLDIGSGGGIDCFEASRRVGPTGRVIGIDMTDEMLAMARTHAPAVADNLGYASSNVEFRKGFADAMPVDDACVDLIVSNCVINLAPDKRRVFDEMFRVLAPGGRFTISDIVSDQPIPNYLIHDREKWGDCLSGALTLHEYWEGLRAAGFSGLHQVGCIPWRMIDGIYFISVTLTGYKLPKARAALTSHATLTGPFSRAVDELGAVFQRGVPQAVDAQHASLLTSPPYREFFVVSPGPTHLSPNDSQWAAVLPKDTPCVWKGDFAILTGPFREVDDDDGHTYVSGTPTEICGKTLDVLKHDAYGQSFIMINRAMQPAESEATGASSGCC